MTALVVLGGGVLVGVAGVRAGALGWFAGPSGALSGVRRRHRLRRRKPAGGDSAVAVGDLVALLDAVGRALRSGLGVHGAVRAAVPVAGIHERDLDSVVTGLDRGVSLASALDQWRVRSVTPAVGLAAAVLAFGLHTGASLPRAVDGAAATLRERLALLGEVRVLSSQARASALVVVGAPVAFTTVVALADQRIPAFLFGTTGGWFCLATGAALEFACVRWMRALVRRAGAT